MKTIIADDATDFRPPPAIAAFIERIGGAELRNFRRFVITEAVGHSHYHHDRYVIRLSADGEVKVHDARGGDVPETMLPTEDEKAAIKAAVAAAGWPQFAPATDTLVDMLRKELRARAKGHDPVLFVFHDAKREVPFVQQRIRTDDGEKADLPWSFWSDGKFRRMEPDGDSLPLFGLDRLQDAPAVYIHEGAKTAQAVQRMCDVLGRKTIGEEADDAAIAACPWIEELRNAAHIGWPGGAPNSHRVDWSPLRTLSPHVPVTIVADNDRPGVDAVPKISRQLKRPLTMVRFADQFPGKFDLADPFPDTDELFKLNKEGLKVYIGPSLTASTSPATWATSDKGLRTEFVEEWYSIIKPAVFINRFDKNRTTYGEAEFNALVAPFSDIPNVAALLRRQLSAQADAIAYEPGKKSGRVWVDGQQAINVYRPSPIRPATGKWDASPFLQYLEHLIPDSRDRANLMRWIATLIARPDIRMTYGVLLISQTQGVGKSTLADKILIPLLGLSNCSFPSMKDIEAKFTSWIARKRLAVIHEIYAGQTEKPYHAMKSFMTDEYVKMEEKYQASYEIKNLIHFIGGSNKFSALRLEGPDRRWFIPGVVERKKPKEYWQQLNEWLRNPDGLPAIAAWAANYVKDHGAVQKGEEAPTSAAKSRALEEARTVGHELIDTLGETLHDLGRWTITDGVVVAHEKRRVVLKLREVQSWLARSKAAVSSGEYGPEGRRLLEKPETISLWLRNEEFGLSLPSKRFKVGGERFRIVANFPLLNDPEWKDLAPWYVDDPDKVFPL